MTPHTLYFTEDERRDALRCAAQVLRERFPQTQASVLVVKGPNALTAHAVLKWPGIVAVSMLLTGDEIASSRPGHPFELADQWLSRGLD